MGEVFTTMIEKNTTIPTKKSQIFSTAADNQPAVTIRIATGNRKMFADNKLLGSFNLDGIPPAPRGMPQIEVTIDVDANNIMSVSAKDLGTGKEQHITITNGSGLSKDEIERMKADAEKYAAEDEKRAAFASKKNAADSKCFSIEKTLKDSADKFTDDEKKSAEDAIAKVKDALKANDENQLENAVSALDAAWEPLVKKLYPSGQNGTPNFSAEDLEKMKNDPNFASFFQNCGPFANNASSNAPKNDGPVDAEVVD